MSLAPAASGIAAGVKGYNTIENMIKNTDRFIQTKNAPKYIKESYSAVRKDITDTARQELVNSLQSGGSGLQIGAQNIVSSLNQIANSSNGAGFTLNGGGTGSLDLPNRQGSFIIWQESPPHNLADIEGKFGKPDGLVRVVGNLTGWVQTEACHLPSNGLPFDIITQAEGLANQGFRIVN